MANISGKDISRRLESKNVTTLKEWFNQDDFKKKLLAALPRVINRDAFIINAYNIYASDTRLQKCTISSFLNALMQAAKVGLMPNTPLGHCYIIPYFNSARGTHEATFQMGYPGHIELALRTSKYKTIYAHSVYPMDEFKRTLGLDNNLIHIPSENPNRKQTQPTHYYAVYKLINGGENFECWTREEVLQHRDKFSSAYRKAKNKKDSVWETDEEAMALKTMIVRVLRHAPKSTEMMYALSTEPGEEGRKNMFPTEEELDITPQVDEVPEDLPEDKPEKENQEEAKEEKEEVKTEETTSSADTPEEVENNMEDLEVIAKEAGYDNWKAIIIEGCKIKASDKKPVFDASVNEEEAKKILEDDQDRFSVLFNHFSATIDSQQVKAGKG